MLRRMLDAPVPGKRWKGRQKTRWKDSGERNRESVGLKEEDVLDRTKWKNNIHNHSRGPRGWAKTRGEEEEESKLPQTTDYHRHSREQTTQPE